MSRHAHVPAPCPVTGKVRFEQHRGATLALRDSRRQQAAAAGRYIARRELRSYRCINCNGWHLTSQARPQAPAEGSRPLPVGV